MSIRSFPFTSVGGDRTMTAADFRQYWRNFATNGIIRGRQAECDYSVDGLTISIGTGVANINGALCVIDNTETVTIVPASSQRYATVVLEFNNNASCRDIHVSVVYGSATVKPNLTQNDNVWQLPICTVRVPANATSLVGAVISDERFYSELKSGLSSNQIKCIEHYPLSSEGTLWGDVDGDGKPPNQLDLVALARYVEGASATIEDPSAGCLTGGTTPTQADVNMLAMCIVYKKAGQFVEIDRVTCDDGRKASYPIFVNDDPRGGDISNLSDEIAHLSDGIEILNISRSNCVLASYCCYLNGAFVPCENYCRTDYLPLPEFSSLYYKINHDVELPQSDDHPAGWAFYDKHKQFLSGGIANEISEIPEDAKYVVFSTYNTGLTVSYLAKWYVLYLQGGGGGGTTDVFNLPPQQAMIEALNIPALGYGDGLEF